MVGAKLNGTHAQSFVNTVGIDMGRVETVGGMFITMNYTMAKLFLPVE